MISKSGDMHPRERLAFCFPVQGRDGMVIPHSMTRVAQTLSLQNRHWLVSCTEFSRKTYLEPIQKWSQVIKDGAKN